MNAIASADRNWGIGKDGKLLVSIPADKAYFKKMTTGKTVIMGRKTLESLPGRKPLKDRRNIVLTRDPDYTAEGALIVHSAAEALDAVSGEKQEDVFVIGGGDIYRELLPYTDCAYITKIDYAYDADAHFPDLDSDPEWEKTAEGEEQTYFDLVYEFDIYQRKAAGS